MIIRNMFADDINRKINGVIKVGQAVDDVIEQELHEYVITKELKKHFITFFNHYSDSFDQPTADIGVWISGFFGSGKSHFLKLLSYLLENKEVNGVRSAECFRKKFADDPATKCKTETILFNIDIEGSINKDKTAVLRVFAKMFYNHLGFYGENLKVAMMEYYLERQGKALIYMHRYQPDTIAHIRTDYVHEQQARYRTAIADLEHRMASASTSKRVKLNKQLTALQTQEVEIRTYEEKIHHLADQMIAINLDDGVKVNYAKFQDVLAKIK